MIYMNPDAINKDIKWKGSDQVWLARLHASDPNQRNADGTPITTTAAPCVAFIDDSGAPQLQSFSKGLQNCSPTNYDFLKAPQYAPRNTSYRSSSIRLYSPPIFDVSFNKMTNITERLKLQFRVEMFNFTNTYAYRVQPFNGNLDDRNFGSLFPRLAGDTEVAYPRHIQLAMKFTW